MEPARTLRRDAAAALALAFGLVLAWTVRDWPQLHLLRLPDTDDALRLQQIRDWLAGQAFGDLRQHRLGPPAGLMMHWSRLPDLAPAALIALLTPFVGTNPATLTAVILWPALLFAAALALTARIAGTLAAPAGTALLVAALAYPATALFLPGRIDHHGLQLLLLLVAVRGMIGPGTIALGIAAGLASAASIAIGLETVPLLAVCGLAGVARWIVDGSGSRARLLGSGAALTLGLAGAAILLSGDGWRYPACDGFVAISWRAAQCGALLPLLLGLASPGLRGWRVRAIAAASCGAVALALIGWLAPGCANPYGAVDPLLRHVWLDRVGEAQPLFAAAPGVALGYAGLLVAGIAASLWCWRRTRDGDWAVLLAIQVGALALTLVQLRGAPAGALLAAPALASMIAAARARGAPATAGAWLVSAGLLYPLAGGVLPNRGGGPNAAACTQPATLAALAALPAGRLLAPVDLGAYAVAATRLSVIAAPYHRNQAANLAMYRFFLGRPDAARGIARRWRVDYVAWCDGGLGALDRDAAAAPDAFVHRRPAWLVPLRSPVPGLDLYRVAR